MCSSVNWADVVDLFSLIIFFFIRQNWRWSGKSGTFLSSLLEPRMVLLHICLSRAVIHLPQGTVDTWYLIHHTCHVTTPVMWCSVYLWCNTIQLPRDTTPVTWCTVHLRCYTVYMSLYTTWYHTAVTWHICVVMKLQTRHMTAFGSDVTLYMTVTWPTIHLSRHTPDTCDMKHITDHATPLTPVM